MIRKRSGLKATDSVTLHHSIQYMLTVKATTSESKIFQHSKSWNKLPFYLIQKQSEEAIIYHTAHNSCTIMCISLHYLFCPAFFFKFCNGKMSSLSEESPSESTLWRLPVGLGICGGFFCASIFAVEEVQEWILRRGTGFPSDAAGDTEETDNLHKPKSGA